MDSQPRTRQETKKNRKAKAHGNNFGSQKHIRLKEKLMENKQSHANDTSQLKTHKQ